MTQMPYTFIWLGVVIMTPESLYWFFVSRPRNKKIKRQQEKTSRFWRIKDLEKDIYGYWKS